jgi:hypothetical protein
MPSLDISGAVVDGAEQAVIQNKLAPAMARYTFIFLFMVISLNFVI